MVAWFEGLELLARVFFCMAVPATLLLVIQLVLLLIGLGHDGGDGLDGGSSGHDFHVGHEVTAGDDLHADVDGVDAGFKLFTLWGIITFFTVMGWSGFAMAREGLTGLATTPIALALGLLAMVLMALLMRSLMRLQQNGAMNIQGAVGRIGQVYLTIPGERNETGKVMMLVDDRYSEFNAVTDEKDTIPTGSEVRVVGITGNNTLVVRQMQEGGKKAWNG